MYNCVRGQEQIWEQKKNVGILLGPLKYMLKILMRSITTLGTMEESG